LAVAQDLIGALGLPAEFAERLDESVRGEYHRLWQMMQDARRVGGKTQEAEA